jgi:hypothetical protein
MACDAIFVRRTIFASLLAIGAAGSVQAEIVGNVVGGGSATITGGGDDMTITYSAGGAGGGGALRSQPGRLARPTGTPTGTGVEYLEPAPSDPGREAWMVGGGDNAEVVYDRR